MELGLSSSPVWYQSKATDCFQGYFAFSSRNVIYLLDVSKNIPSYCGILSGHDAKINTCSFRHFKDEDQILLASGGEDGSVKIWDVGTKQILHEHRVHSQNKITCLDWSTANKDLVISGDERGAIVVWDMKSDSTNRYFPETVSLQQLSCVACSPHYPNLVVIGYKSGAASVVDINNRGKIIRKLRGHDQEIQCLLWSPYATESILNDEENIQGENNSNELAQEKKVMEGIIVTSSKDRTIRMWSLSSGKCLNVLQLPSKSSKGRHGNSDASKLYLALFWPKLAKNTFISSTYGGEIIHWDISSTPPTHQIIGSHCRDTGHQRIIFNITSGKDDNCIITTSMDRCIKHWSFKNDLSQIMPDWSLPTLGGFVYSIDVSPTDPSNVGIGVGDGIIRIWKTKNPRNPFDVSALWQGVKEKVMSMAWHPTKEGILAYGTEDGKVGVYDVLSLRPPTIASTYHLKPVYSMSWGPICFKKEKNNEDHLTCLYSCGGEGIIFMHEHSKLKYATDINMIIQSTNQHLNHVTGKHSELSWMRHGDLLAVGNEDGCFHIYQAPHLNFITTYKVHNKIINCLSWCPVVPSHDQHYLIASGSNNSHICVNDLKHIVGQCLDQDPDVAFVTQSYRTLSGHTSRITDLSWNPSNVNQLVSSSYDGTAQVWDVIKEEPTANYRGHSGRVLCVMWSPMPSNDEGKEIIYSGGDDYSVHVWSPSNQQHREPPKGGNGTMQKNNNQWKKKNRKKRTNVLHQVQITPVESEQIPPIQLKAGNDQDFDIEVLLEQKRAELLEEMNTENEKPVPLNDKSATSSLNPTTPPWINRTQYRTENMDDSALREVLDGLSKSRQNIPTNEEIMTSQHKRKRLKNLFPVSIAKDNRKKELLQQDCIDIVRSKTENQSRGDLGFYGNRVSAYRMLAKEDKQTLEDKNIDANAILKLWGGDIVGMLENAIKCGELTDQMVSMTPMAGHDVWQHACSAFAEQLTNDGHYLHASQYLLCCSKVKEAIVLLRDAKLHREAVALSRARLSDDDPLLRETCRLWAKKLKHGGSFEMAAKCFSSIGDYIHAAECLATRAMLKPCLGKDEHIGLFSAAAVARLAGERVIAKGYADRVITSVLLRTGMWKEAHEAAVVFGKTFMAQRYILCSNEILWFFATSRNGEFRLVDAFSDVSPWLSDTDYGNSLKEIMEIEFEKRFSEVPQLLDDLPSICAELEYIFADLSFMSISTDKLTLKQIFYQMSVKMTQLHFTTQVMGSNIVTNNTFFNATIDDNIGEDCVIPTTNFSEFEEQALMYLRSRKSV